MLYDLSPAAGCDNYDFLTQVVLPRPIAWILSENADGGLNLAPFSYFNLVASRPALFSVSIGVRSPGTPKDTRRNLVAGRPCVIHLPGVEHIDAVNASSAALPEGDSEVGALGLETVPFEGFGLPRLAGVAVAIGGQLRREVTFEGVPQSLLVIEGHRAYVNPRVLADPSAETTGKPTLDPRKLNPLARLGRIAYGTLGEVVNRNRPR